MPRFHPTMGSLSGIQQKRSRRFASPAHFNETINSTRPSARRRPRGCRFLETRNLAKQLGAAGDNKRTDLMGLLLLISPPGYGKTPLMEYIANRLGLIFMKINGPAVGHEVTSLDPSEAGNAGAREEVQKLNLALEMGDNVMIYLDDIQHCNPEFLQKFISLCDAQRKIEGVWEGRPRTYDLKEEKSLWSWRVTSQKAVRNSRF